MPAYAVAHMRQVTMGPAIVEHLDRIDATLPPFGGRILVHGGDVEVVTGPWPGYLIIIKFPGRAAAHDWYRSAAYQGSSPCTRTTHTATSSSSREETAAIRPPTCPPHAPETPSPKPALCAR